MVSSAITSASTKRRFSLARCLAVALIVLPLAACGSWFDKEVQALDDHADKLYNEGFYLLNNRRDYKAAEKKFEEVDRQHPYSD